MNPADMLGWLEAFYFGYCDGDWEHQCGITITTIDNPGWSVTVDLEGTVLFGASFESVEIERSENDWIQCSKKLRSWEGVGGPHNLREILETFRRWTESTRQLSRLDPP